MTYSQEVQLNAQNTPLNQVLNELGIELSFDDKALSQYHITSNETFDTPEKALNFLLQSKPYGYEKINGVFVILPISENKNLSNTSQIRKRYKYSGQIIDSDTSEGLPYSFIRTNQGTICCDETGYFSILRNSKEPLKIEVQHLGYNLLDTMITNGSHQLALSYKTFEMDELVVYSSPDNMMIQSGRTSGEIRVNHEVAQYIPGSVDNSLFNLLRMMPGVRASGEPSDELIVWGSNSGEGLISYDGITVFGLKNYNDHIGLVNPYLVKDISLKKGGYDASYGGRIGAVAEITGGEGNYNEFEIKAGLSNYVANIYTSVPITKRLAITAAYRQTFYNLYYGNTYNRAKHSNQNRELYIKPKYKFKDLNFKLAGKAFQNDNYYITLYGADDQFKFDVSKEDLYNIKAKEKNEHYGAAAAYNRVWNNGESTKLLAAYSKLNSRIDNLNIMGKTGQQLPEVNHIHNSIQEIKVNLNHKFNLNQYNNLKVGGEWLTHIVCTDEDRIVFNIPSLYLTDQLMYKKFSLDLGLRAEYPNTKLKLLPRISAKYSITDHWTATSSWGLYNQYVRRVPVEFGDNNYQMLWNVSDSVISKSMNAILGIAYSNYGFLISAEGFYKKSENGLYFLNNNVYQADNTIWGADLFIKQEYKEHSIFGSYSLVKSQEPNNELSHEIKLGGVAGFDPFYFSISSVYGTGFNHLSTGGHGHGKGSEGNGGHGTKQKKDSTIYQSNGHQHGQNRSSHSSNSYKRVDISALYKTDFSKCRLKAGVSLMNLFGSNNVKYNYQLIGEQSVTNVFTKATPFTVTAFIEIAF